MRLIFNISNNGIISKPMNRVAKNLRPGSGAATKRRHVAQSATLAAKKYWRKNICSEINMQNVENKNIHRCIS